MAADIPFAKDSVLQKEKGILYSIFFTSASDGPLEDQLPTPVKTYEIRTPIVVNAPAATLWENVIRVKEIAPAEYSKRLFQLCRYSKAIVCRNLTKDFYPPAPPGSGILKGGLIFQRNSHRTGKEISRAHLISS